MVYTDRVWDDLGDKILFIPRGPGRSRWQKPIYNIKALLIKYKRLLRQYLNKFRIKLPKTTLYYIFIIVMHKIPSKVCLVANFRNVQSLARYIIIKNIIHGLWMLVHHQVIWLSDYCIRFIDYNAVDLIKIFNWKDDDTNVRTPESYKHGWE